MAILPKCANVKIAKFANSFQDIIEETKQSLQNSNNTYKLTSIDKPNILR